MRRRGFLGRASALCFFAAGSTRAEGGHAEALSGDRITLDGAELRLADIIAPSPIGLSNGAQPYADQSRHALTTLVASGGMAVADAAEPDRWGRRVVVARMNDGRSLQEALIDAGAARVAPSTDAFDFIDNLLIRERKARAAKRGLWALDEYRVRNATDAHDAIGGFHLVEGVVKRAAKTKGRVYLNFGADYRKDFTASARSILARRWAKSGLDLLALEGARVRTRGFVDSINGPSIELVHEKRIELL